MHQDYDQRREEYLQSKGIQSFVSTIMKRKIISMR
jgi:hypothetical protein